jgi:drug/metabolite transporter (DMT)-like permease
MLHTVPMFLQAILLIFGVLCCSTAVIMIKQGSEAMPPVLLAAGRQLLAALLLAGLFWRDSRRHRGTLTSRQLRRCILPGAMLGVHFITWIVGARLTLAANSSLIVNMVPVVMPFLLLVLMRESLNRGELIGTVLAVAGLAALAVADFHVSREHLAGDITCFVSMLFLAVYLALGRRNRDVPSIWLYIVPVYLVGGLVCLLVSAGLAAVWLHPAGRPLLESLHLAKSNPLLVPTAWDWLMILGLAVVPTLLGHSIINACMRVMRGQIVSLATLGQFIFSSIMATFLLSPPEFPEPVFYLASVLIVAGAVFALRAMSSQGDRLAAEGMEER